MVEKAEQLTLGEFYQESVCTWFIGDKRHNLNVGLAGMPWFVKAKAARSIGVS